MSKVYEPRKLPYSPNIGVRIVATIRGEHFVLMGARLVFQRASMHVSQRNREPPLLRHLNALYPPNPPSFFMKPAHKAGSRGSPVSPPRNRTPRTPNWNPIRFATQRSPSAKKTPLSRLICQTDRAPATISARTCTTLTTNINTHAPASPRSSRCAERQS